MYEQDVRHPAIEILRRFALGALLAAVAATSAHAASFDCQAARSATEQAICASPKLSALDELMAQTYERAMHALSAEGAAQLKESQRSWLRFTNRVCAPGKRRKAQEDVSNACLERTFTLRVKQLDHAGLRLGPYVFNRIDRYQTKAVQADDDTGEHPGVVWKHVGYPQIDAPKTAAAIAWNSAQHRDLATTDSGEDAEAASDEDTDYAIGCIGDRFISLDVSTSEYPHGAAHGTYGFEEHNAVLVPALRKMAATDIFAASSDWKARLPELFWDVYAHREDAIKDMPEIEEAIRQSAADPDAWLLTPSGLQISFSAYQAGCYACSPGPITVPWATLKPMLATPEFAACKAPPAAKP